MVDPSALPTRVLERVLGSLAVRRKTAQALRADLPSPGIWPANFRQFITDLGVARDEINTARSVPGMAAAAQREFGAPVKNIVADFDAFLTQATSLIAWAESNFPNSQGLLHEYSWVGDGSGQVRQTRTAEVANLAQRLDSLIAAMDAALT